MGNTRKILMGASALAGALSIALTATSAAAETRPIAFDLPAQPLGESLRDFYRESGEQIVFSEDLVAGRTSPALKGSYTADQALAMLLEGTNLTARRTSTGVVMVEAPQSGSAAGDGADAGTVQALIVTAQKREENIQDVPIAISAFTEKSLQEQKIEGGFDLLKAIPNVTFSKNNFTSYNFSIRGIGTKAVSATTDPGVAVSFNNSALLQNRLFEQEYFDIERVEVLRGPQGTLYGRNATAGVVNVITAKPNLHEFSGWLKGEVGNYHSKRISAMVNVPLVTDRLGIRIAGALTDRQGYDFNEGTGNPVNGRDLWSGRLTLQFNPIDRLRTQVIWERFNEDDNRSRTGKQLCHRDPGPLKIGNTDVYEPIDFFNDGRFNKVRQSIFSQGCAAGSLYDAGAFGTPNGLSLPYIIAFGETTTFGAFGPPDADGVAPGVISFLKDPYASATQSQNLRVIDSIKDPRYVAKADIVQLNIDFDVTDKLTFFSQTVYDKDSTYSTQDYNRFNTAAIINDTSNWPNFFGDGPSAYQWVAPGSYFNDPQLGKTNKMVSYDQASAKGTQFGEELRLQSDFDGPVNFSVGANYTRFKTLVDYYVFNNLFSMLGLLPPLNFAGTFEVDPYTQCRNIFAFSSGVAIDDPRLCPYVDPKPLESINGEGHNYFRSKNPYKLSSTAAFGEVYWKATDRLKVTAGLRYTDDRKTFTPVPSQVLLAYGTLAGGTVERGYPELADIKQHWGEWTGRLGVDWRPEVSFTDQTMLYAFYSRGYKGGGANPPAPGFGTMTLFDYGPQFQQQLVNSLQMWGLDEYVPYALARFQKPILSLTGVEYGRTFKPEFVNAFEVGAKNTLMGGALMANVDAFFYDYKDYQVSQIRDRTAVNENFDARVWGTEFEVTFAPSHDLQFRGTLGYLDSRIADGEKSIDIMNRTQGNPDFVLAKGWMQLPSNCIAPKAVVENWLQTNPGPNQYWLLCGGTANVLDYLNLPVSLSVGAAVIDPNNINPDTGNPRLYDPNFYNGTNGRPDIHGGAGIAADLSGNELPNAPHWTISLGGQYGHDILDGSWRATIRADAYWQSQSWARVYNAVNDKLHGWYNANLSVWFERPEDDLKIELYAKNILDKTPITDAFINSDDSALTTNVFVLDPRLIGLSIHKGF